MKKGIVLLLVLVLSLCLIACGKSEEVKAVEAMMGAIETVSAENLEEVYAAITAYDALSEEDAEKVRKYDAFTDKLDAWLTENVVGQWTYEPRYFYNVEEMYDKVDLTLNADGSAVGSHVSGPWRVEDSEIRVNNGKADYVFYTFFEEGRLTIGSVNAKMLPQEAYHTLLDEMFVTVEVTPENVADYCEIVIYTEIEEDDFGVITGDTRTYATLQSKVCDEGLLFLEGSDDLAIELMIPEHSYKYRSNSQKWRKRTEDADTQVVKRHPYGSYGGSLGHLRVESDYEAVHDITADQITFGRVTGKITFIRSEYVKEIKKAENYNTRVLVLYNDEEINAGNWRPGLDY